MPDEIRKIQQDISDTIMGARIDIYHAIRANDKLGDKELGIKLEMAYDAINQANRRITSIMINRSKN